MANWVMTPAVVIRPILLPESSANHSAPSGPAAMPKGPLLAVGRLNSLVTTPSGVIRPILLPLYSVNHSAPSGPAAMARLEAEAVGMAYSVMACCAAAGVRRRKCHDRAKAEREHCAQLE